MKVEGKIRPLRADEIEIRIARIKKGGYQLLLYKDSRCDKRILDEVFGMMGWKNEYQEIKGNLYCTISVWNNDLKQWISKQDCGTKSNVEKEKGEASDAFKRAATAWGIGRELYTRLFIWVNGGVQPKLNAKKEQIVVSGEPQYELINPFMKWHVGKLEVDEETEKIVGLTVEDDKGIQVYSYGTCAPKGGRKDEFISPSDIEWQMENIDMATVDQIKKIRTGCEFLNIKEASLLKTMKLKKWEEATFQQAEHAIHYLNQKADMKAMEGGA